MLDTVRLRSPSLDKGSAWAVEQACERRQTVSIKSNEVLWELTTGNLEGSWDERVSVRVMREELVYDPEIKHTEWRACEPYLFVEGSVHKALLGHNVAGGPLDPVAACRWFVADVGKRLGCPLPEALLWTVQRLDWAEVYDLGSFEAVDEFLHALRMARMPRRKPHVYPGGVYYPGQTTTLKLYHKGPEFRKHDRKRLSVWLQPSLTEPEKNPLEELQEQAHRLLRFETELHARKLDDDYRESTGSTTGKPPVWWITQDYLERVHDREAGRLLREGASDMQTVRNNRSVSKRLKDVYGQTLGDQLFGTWLQFAALGEEVAKQEMPRSTYYWRRKKLVEAGVSWHGSDVRVIAQTAIPEGFSPVRGDPRRLALEDPLIRQQLAPFRLAA